MMHLLRLSLAKAEMLQLLLKCVKVVQHWRPISCDNHCNQAAAWTFIDSSCVSTQLTNAAADVSKPVIIDQGRVELLTIKVCNELLDTL